MKRIIIFQNIVFNIERNQELHFIFFSIKKSLKKLRDQQITVSNVNFIESKRSFFIQLSDLVANITYKLIKKNFLQNHQANPLNIFDQLDQEKIFIISCKFPHIEYNENVRLCSCNLIKNHS